MKAVINHGFEGIMPYNEKTNYIQSILRMAHSLQERESSEEKFTR